jgi:hypothetical protein
MALTQAAVYYIPNLPACASTRQPTWDGQACLRHVGRHHHQAVAGRRRPEHARLLCRGQHGVQGQHVQGAGAIAGAAASAAIAGLGIAAAGPEVCRQACESSSSSDGTALLRGWVPSSPTGRQHGVGGDVSASMGLARAHLLG